MSVIIDPEKGTIKVETGKDFANGINTYMELMRDKNGE